jgi:hypothetical protein
MSSFTGILHGFLFQIRKNPLDGDQDLNFWTLEIEDLVCKIMEDPIFKGSQNYKFEMDLD